MIKLEIDSKTGKGFVEGKSKNNDELMNEACNAVRGIVEYVAKTTNQTSKIEKGAKLQMCYPPELLVIPSPVAIFKGTAKLDPAKKFVDYLLSKEAQQLVANQGTIPVREDVTMPNKYFKLPAPKEAMAKAIPIDYLETVKSKEATIKKFSEIMAVKK